MVRKAGGLAAIMAGQPVVETPSMSKRIVKLFRASILHIGLSLGCCAYILVGAAIFRTIEQPNEIAVREHTIRTLEVEKQRLLEEADRLAETHLDLFDLEEAIQPHLDHYIRILFKLCENPISTNYFDHLFYNGSLDMWTDSASILFTATTVVPVGFGLITPLTVHGRLFLVVYAGIGIPLALVTMSDLGRFFADATFKLFGERMTVYMLFLLALLFIYPLVCGFIIYLVSTLPLFDSIYYCCITILTVGYGDIGPPIPTSFLVVFIVVGVTLVTVSVDVVAANAIHHIHYMGRQMGRAKLIAGKMMQMAQKISINRGLGLGMAQLGAFARFGMMIKVDANGDPLPQSPKQRLMSVAFDPQIDFDFMDRGGATSMSMGGGFTTHDFGYMDGEDGDDSDNESTVIQVYHPPKNNAHGFEQIEYF